MFPHGAPGIALLVLRISVATVLAINAVTDGWGVSSNRILFVIALASAVSLSIGLLTPYLSGLAAAFAVANLLTGAHARDYLYVFPIFDALILSVLGPGAYSLDARLFGRKVTVMPPRKATRR
jgi:uncharacterized membrane protein YphA (DoxX/SURF4 family)